MAEARARTPQPWPVRLTHWLNLPLLVIMWGSGLQIFAAFPSLGPRGEAYAWYPFHGIAPPAWLRLGEWLAGARHWHFAFAWFFVLNGIVYAGYLAASGEWRRRLFSPRRDTRNALATLAYYLRVKKTAPPQTLYNGLQRLAYTSVLPLAIVMIASGLAIYKPVQLAWLARLFGGYDGARAVHLLGLASLALFSVLHVVMVALHPRAFVDMITGGKPEVPRATDAT